MIEALLQKAFSVRAGLVDDKHITAFRLFNGFLEGFPALSLDIYARTALIQDYAGQPGGSQADTAVKWVLTHLPWVGTVLVKTRAAPTAEGKRGIVVHGSQLDRKICENGVWYAVNLQMNQDASFYLDTRNLRTWARETLADKSVLNTFAYTGSLGVAALSGGASRVLQLDRSRAFLELANQSCRLNGYSTNPRDWMAQDFFPAVAHLKRSGQTFDCIFLDPPFFASSSRGTVDLEAGSIRLINKVRPLVNNGGWLVAINNALYVSGRDYLTSLESLCADGYLAIESLIPVPADFTGYPETIATSAPVEPAPFNHSTKIAVLRVRRK